MPHWFEINTDLAKQLIGIPGLKPHPKIKDLWLVHRTHLPLLESEEARRVLMGTDELRGHWALRDQWTAHRGFKLRTFQQQSLDFINPRRGVLLALEQRLGKTAAATMAHDPARGPLVVVAPLSTRAVWLGWIKKIFPDLPIGVLTGKSKISPERLKRPIVFCHYDVVRYWQASMPIGTLVLDECHLLTSKNTWRSKGAGLLASRAQKVIAATGTPIWSLPSDLWNIVGMLTPGAWGSYWDFGRRYGDPFETEYGVEFRGISHKEELTSRLTEIMIRRLWRDVSTELPPISRSIVVVDIDDVTRRRLDVLAGKIKSERTNTAGNLSHYRSQLSRLKAKAVIKEAQQILDRGEPVVVWTWHKELANIIYNELAHDGRAFLIHGDIAPDLREERMDAWRRAEKPSALIATMAVAQVGIDLSHAHMALVAELDYTPAVLGQMEMRTYSPDHPMNVTYFVGDHVVDQRITRSLIGKLNAADPLGLGAAVDAIDALRDALDGPQEEGDMVRFLDDLLAAGGAQRQT